MSFYLKMLSKALWRSRAVFDKANTNSKLFALDQGGKIHLGCLLASGDLPLVTGSWLAV